MKSMNVDRCSENMKGSVGWLRDITSSSRIDRKEVDTRKKDFACAWENKKETYRVGHNW